MPIEIISDLKPINNAPFPVSSVQYIQGAYLSVPTIAARNAIYPNLRATGMLVHIQADGNSYRLVGGIENSNWVGEAIASYTHTQSSAASSWLITHNLGYNPGIETLYVSGQIIGLISYPTGGILARVDFNKNYAGTGYCS